MNAHGSAGATRLVESPFQTSQVTGQLRPDSRTISPLLHEFGRLSTPGPADGAPDLHR